MVQVGWLIEPLDRSSIPSLAVRPVSSLSLSLSLSLLPFFFSARDQTVVRANRVTRRWPAKIRREKRVELISYRWAVLTYYDSHARHDSTEPSGPLFSLFLANDAIISRFLGTTPRLMATNAGHVFVRSVLSPRNESHEFQ